MKIVGECNLSLMGRAAMKAPKALRKRDIKVVCLCGSISNKSELLIKRFPHSAQLCAKCNIKRIAESKAETNKALIGLAKNKGLIQ